MQLTPQNNPFAEPDSNNPFAATPDATTNNPFESDQNPFAADDTVEESNNPFADDDNPFGSDSVARSPIQFIS